MANHFWASFSRKAVTLVTVWYCSTATVQAQYQHTNDSLFKGNYVLIKKLKIAADRTTFRYLEGQKAVVLSEFLQINEPSVYSGIVELKDGKPVYLDHVVLMRLPADPPPFVSTTIEQWKTDQFLQSLEIPASSPGKANATKKNDDDFLNSLSIENAGTVQTPTVPSAPASTPSSPAAKLSLLDDANSRQPDLSVTSWINAPQLYSDLSDAANQQANAGNYDAAISYCNAVIRLYPKLSNSYLLRGRIHAYFGKYRTAIRDMEYLQSYSPELKTQADQYIAAWRPLAARESYTKEEWEAVKRGVDSANAASAKIISKPSYTYTTITCPVCGGSGKVEKFGRHTGYIDMVDYSTNKKVYTDFGVSEGFYTETCYRCSGTGKITQRGL